MADNKSYYSDDAIKAKLSSLNEAQDVIVNVAQWLLFNKRNAVRTAELWMQRVKDSQPAKRLSLVYLANEVVQQSKARKKEEFVNAFAPHIVEATGVAYRSSPHDIQQKLKRVVEVWRARYIFDLKTQSEVEAKIEEIDRSRATSSKRGLGGSLFAESTQSIPSKLTPVFDAHNSLTQAESKSSNALSLFESESANKQAENDPSLPRKAAHLGSLLQALESAQSGVSASMKARQTLMASLEALLADNKAALSREETRLSNLVTKKAAVEVQKRHVEDMIVRGSTSNGSAELYEPPRPDAEPLTPPPVESLTPVSSPKPAPVPNALEPSASVPVLGGFPGFNAALPKAITEPILGPAETVDASSAERSPKRRKIGVNDDDFVFNSDALGGIDPDVAAMLAQ